MNYSVKKINLGPVFFIPLPRGITHCRIEVKTSYVSQDTNRTTACLPLEKLLILSIYFLF